MKTKLLDNSLILYMRAAAFLLVFLMGLGVDAQPFPKSSKFKVGMTAGINSSLITGTELENPTPRTSMVLGASYRQKLSKAVHFGAEVNASFRGSNFDNGIVDAYHMVRFIYLDVPLNAMINTSGKAENRYLTLGVEPAYQMRSEIFVKPDDIRPRVRNEGFRRFDVAALLGYHFDFYYFGLRPSVRFGLLDINDNLFLENVMPETGKGGTIKNITFDVKLYF